jgi:hypothetical protein
MTSKVLKEMEERDELRQDSERIRVLKGDKCFMREITKDDNKRLDELHIKFVEEYNINDIKDLQLVKKIFDFLKEN